MQEFETIGLSKYVGIARGNLLYSLSFGPAQIQDNEACQQASQEAWSMITRYYRGISRYIQVHKRQLGMVMDDLCLKKCLVRQLVPG